MTIRSEGPYDDVLSGTISGGMAQFVQEISPIDLKVFYEADMTILENTAEGVSLSIVTSPIGSRLVTTAVFKQGSEYPAVSMSCRTVSAPLYP